MEAKSLHYSGLLTTLQLRLAEGCWRNGFHDRFVQSGIFSNLENFYSRHGSIDTIKIWSKHLHVQLPSSASKYTQESVYWIYFSSWLVKNLARNFWAYYRRSAKYTYVKEDYKKKVLKFLSSLNLKNAPTSNYNKCEYNWCLLWMDLKSSFAVVFLLRLLGNFCCAWSWPRRPIWILICSFA